MNPPEPMEVRIRARSGWLWLDWQGLVAYRDLILLLVHRDYASKYKQTILGPAWAVVTPIVTAVVFGFVFGRVLGVQTDGVPPSLFYLCGLLGWNYFNQTLNATSNTLRSNYAIFSKVYFPRLVTPLATVLSNLAASVVQLLTFAVIYAITIGLNSGMTARPTWAAFALPLLFLHLAALALGGGLLLSAMTAKYRDFQQITPFLLNLLLYVTPVIYPISQIPEKWRWLAAVNPVAPVIEAFRAVLFGTSSFDPAYYAVSIAVTVAVLIVGVGYYQRLARDFVDYA